MISLQVYLFDTSRDQSAQPHIDATGNLTYILEHKRGPVRILERCPDKPQIVLR